MITQILQKLKENWQWLVMLIGIPAIIIILIYIIRQQKNVEALKEGMKQ